MSISKKRKVVKRKIGKRKPAKRKVFKREGDHSVAYEVDGPLRIRHIGEFERQRRGY